MKNVLIFGVMMLILCGTAFASNYIEAEICDSTNYQEWREIKTYLIDGKEYEVKLSQIGFDEDGYFVKFEVNGEITPNVYRIDESVLADGMTIVVRDILYQNYDGGVKAVWFCFNGEAGEIVEEPEELEVSPREEILPEDLETYPVTMGVDLSNFPELFFKDGVFNSYFVVGDQSPAVDNLAMTDIAAGISNDQRVIPSGSTKLDIEVDNPLENNLIVISTGCSNKIVQELADDDCKQVSPGEAALALFENNGYAQLVIIGGTGEDTRRAARALANGHGLEGTTMVVSGITVHTTPGEEIKSEISSFAECVAAGYPILESYPAQCKDPSTGKTFVEKIKTPVIAPTYTDCTGCKVNGNCLPYGTRLLQEGKAAFCNIDGAFEEQQDIGDLCQNNYECSSNQCSNGKCIDLSGQLEETTGLLEKIFAWAKRIFGN